MIAGRSSWPAASACWHWTVPAGPPLVAKRMIWGAHAPGLDLPALICLMGSRPAARLVQGWNPPPGLAPRLPTGKPCWSRSRPVLLGAALAWHDTQAPLLILPLLAAALGAAFIQIRDQPVDDLRRFPARHRSRIASARRATAEGWLTPRAVAAGAWTCFALAFACGIYLVWLGGWPIVAIGLASAGGAGPTQRPQAHRLRSTRRRLGFSSSGRRRRDVLPANRQPEHDGVHAASLLGLHAAAVITVNNYRDRDGDQRSTAHAGSQTRPPATRILYALEMLLPYGLLLPLAVPGSLRLLPALTLPLALILIRRFWRTPAGPAFNTLLAQTAALQFVFACLLAAGFLV